MRGRSILATTALLFVSSLACGALGDGDAALEKQESFAARTCACADVACIRKVQEAQAKWVSDHGDELVAAGIADSDRLQAALDKTAQCVERISKAQAGEITGGGDPSPGTKQGGGRKKGKGKGKRKKR